MKLVYSDLKQGRVKAGIDSIDDLWYLSTIIEAGDVVEGKTVRKMKFGGEEKQKAERKKVFLKIRVEKVEFEAEQRSLRVLGTIEEGPDDVPLGSHHSFDLRPGDSITITKEKWLGFQKKRLEEAANDVHSNILVVVMDREEAYLALLKKSGYDVLAVLKGDVAKKSIEQEKNRNFYEEIIKAVQEYDRKYDFESIIIASPAFWKEELMKNIKDEGLRKRIVQATCSSCDERAISEVMKRPEVNTVLEKDRATREIRLVEELLKEVSRGGLCAYGIDEVRAAAEAGAAETLLLTDRFIHQAREKGEHDKTEAVMAAVEKNKGEMHIISSDHDGGKRLDGLGGIGAVLRYRVK